MNAPHDNARDAAANARRIVVKIGSSVLTRSGSLEPRASIRRATFHL